MLFRHIKEFVVGKPLETYRIQHERLPKWKALPIFSSDALSSVAYATQEILIPLAALSALAMNWSLLIGAAIACLLAIVASSYWQTIRTYPNGGGAYVVVMENLGVRWGLITGAALLIDYILTVAVSAAAGVEAIASAVPFFFEHKVALGCVAVALVTLVNLRGVRESGSVFALPTYVFIASFAGLILTGFYKLWTGQLAWGAPIFGESYPQIEAFLILKAFSSGCAALTGIEAISNGVPAFEKPESKNAQITLAWMAVILGTLFLGITALAHIRLIAPPVGGDGETVISLLTKEIVGTGFYYYLIQFSTALILFLAANTAFADFPRVCSLLAQDRFLPRQLASLGDRLVFSNGILLLGVVSALLIALFGGTTHRLIPLYAVGVFLSFTLSQIGMIKHHRKFKEPGWRLGITLNTVGAIATFVVLCVITVTKFTHGAYLVVIVIPLLGFWFRSTRDHYRKVAAQLALVEDVDFKRPIKHVVVLPISGIHKGVVDAIKYAKSISDDVRIVCVDLDPTSTERLKTAWAKLDCGLKLEILESPYRSVVGPILDYIHNVDKEAQDDLLTVVIPEFVTARWWHSIFHNQTALVIRTALLFDRGKVVTSVRYHLQR